jgi:hypothetical protein
MRNPQYLSISPLQLITRNYHWGDKKNQVVGGSSGCTTEKILFSTQQRNRTKQVEAKTPHNKCTCFAFLEINV